MRHVIVLVAFAVVASASTRAQSLYFEDFSAGTPGWTLETRANGVAWRVDDLPASTPNGAAHSAPASLNCNNDVDYVGLSWHISATSPPIDLSTATGVPMLVFWCNNQTVESTCVAHEWTRLEVVGHTTYKVGSNDVCSANCTSSAWHPHMLALDSAWGTVQLRFKQYSDGIMDEGPGWFVDDIGIYDSPAPVSYCSSKVMSSSCVPHVAWWGALPSTTDPNACNVACTGAAPLKSGVFFYGLQGRAATPFLGGTLCVQAPLKRTFVMASIGPAGWPCQGYFEFDFNAWIQSGVDPALIAGATVDGQFWFREPNSSFDTGLSDGIELVIQP